MGNTRILSKSAEFGIIRQPGTAAAANAFHCGGGKTSGWGNIPTDATNYRRVQYNKDSVIFDPAVTIDQYESTAQNGIHDEDAQFFIDKLSGLPTMTFAMPADVKTLAPHLVGALGTVTEDGSSPFLKTITCAGLTGPVDFTAEGVGTDTFPLHAISMTDTGGDADDGKWIDNAIIQDLTLEWDFNAQGIARLMQMSGTWIGNKINLDQSMSGTIVDTTLTPYNNTESYSFSTLLVGTIDWTGLAFRRYTFTVNNNVTKDDSTTAGAANQYNISPEYTSTIILNYDATTEKVMGDYQQGDLVLATIVSSTTPTLDGGIDIACTKGRLMSQPEIYEGEYKGVQLDIKWYADAATTGPVTIRVTDELEWTYGDDTTT